MVSIEDTEEMRQAWAAEQLAGAPAEELASLEQTDALKSMLAQPEVKEKATYIFGDVAIKHHRYMTYRFRNLLSKATTGIQSAADPVGELNALVYQALAEICTENPYNTPLFWRIVDVKSADGRVFQIFVDIIQRLGGDANTLKSFQRIPARPVSS